jgi:hypothetical protein
VFKASRLFLLLTLVLTLSIAFGTSYRPRTFEEKIKEADLIVLGGATAFGDEVAVSGGLFTRNLRVDVKEVIWPPSYKETNAIVFRYYIVKTWPKSWWDYSNTAGIFFLKKNEKPERGQWDRLDRFDDWMEDAMHAPAVRASVKRLKEKPGKSISVPLVIPQ